MQAYLRGYYGYQNFGDELLFFGVIHRLFSKYPLHKLYVEVGNRSWMEDRIRTNYQWLLSDTHMRWLVFVNAKQHFHKSITHLCTMLWWNKYKDMFKFFWGGEVLSDQRPFPHDGRNLPLLFHHTIRQGKFALLWWITPPHKLRTKLLYRYLLPKAERIVLRDKVSFNIATNHNPTSSHLYHDFAQDVLKRLSPWSSPVAGKYILININHQMCTPQYLQQIVDFCHTYPHHKKIFFPGDIHDDMYCFDRITSHIPWCELYQWTHHTLIETLGLFAHADAGIGARLHFLLPLKWYHKPMVAIPYADKIHALMSSS